MAGSRLASGFRHRSLLARRYDTRCETVNDGLRLSPLLIGRRNPERIFCAIDQKNVCQVAYVLLLKGNRTLTTQLEFAEFLKRPIAPYEPQCSGLSSALLSVRIEVLKS